MIRDLREWGDGGGEPCTEQGLGLSGSKGHECPGPRLPWTGKGGGAARTVGSDVEVSWGPAQAWLISGRDRT